MNIVLAFTWIAFALFVGELISSMTKAKIPSMFVSAIVFIVGFWTFVPDSLLEDAGISGNLAAIIVYIMIVNVGTLISIEELKRQWKIVLIVLFAMLGAGLLIMGLGSLLIGKQLAAVGTPPLMGSLVSTLLMRDAAMEAGLKEAAVVAVAVWVLQSFVGYPLTAVFLKKEGKTILEQYRNGSLGKAQEEVHEDESSALLRQLPDYWNTTYFALLRLGLLAYLAVVVSAWFAMIGINLHAAVASLILGLVGRLTGLLEKNTLVKANANGFMTFGLMAYIFDGLKITTPSILLDAMLPALVVLFFGVLGLYLFSLVAGKVLKVSPYLSFSTALTALYGFPGDMIITQEVAKSLTDNELEQKELVDHMLPSMLIGGFVSVTIVSVIVASYFIPLVVG
ncbi:Uncharacterised protein [Streptococcus acidominimus]|uniref:Uncharacterized protein n=1 Tax=Streptococcus acidominimus TaxID=1326 RepID=A0A239WU59_STRAI|nr:hypothetical protein [Streptococcus acidominimus]SNV38021.1 Uncharacterised protein [Streptococcus acidominimus]